MTPKEIKENNKLIAEFMGWDWDESGETFFTPHSVRVIDEEDSIDGHHVYDNELPICFLKFHESWDWLLPVFKKCADIFGQWDYDDERRTEAEEIFHPDFTLNNFFCNDIESIYKRCVEFIQQYNQQQ